ncbi:hypothetical protein BDB01DRAFT_848305 [Pilobolus umbonatus]|nr:hypothetical protein BDB01DRAFT_848305 [Pilobolus umbonatus]
MTRDAHIITRKNSNRIPCLEHVLSYLSISDLVRACTVSKSWHTIVTKRIWSHFKFTRERDFEKIFSILSRNTTYSPYGQHITSLELIHSERDFTINSNVIFLISLLCPNLLSITLTFHHTRPVAPPVHHLIKVRPTNNNNIKHNPKYPPPPNEPPRHSPSLPLAHLSNNCPSLKYIKLNSYNPRTDDSVYEMAKYMKSGSLESIILYNCSTIQSSTLCKIAITNPQLKRIEIMGNTAVTDSSLAVIADRCGANLEYLSIGNAYSVTNKSLIYIAKRCTQLKQLCMFNNNPNTDQFSEDTLTAIITHCHLLESLSLSDARCLGPKFFNAVLQRIHVEVNKLLISSSSSSSSTSSLHSSCSSHSSSPTTPSQDMPVPLTHTGLQRLCLGNVKRDIIQSEYIQELNEISASKHDRHIYERLNIDRPYEDMINSNELADLMTQHNPTSAHNSHINNGRKPQFMPKSTVIRGNTIWWERRQFILQDL